MTLEEAVDLACPFARQERADRVDERASGRHQRRSDIDQAFLHTDEAVEPFGREPPTPFRVAAPGAGAGAGRIDEDEIGGVAPVD